MDDYEVKNHIVALGIPSGDMLHADFAFSLAHLCRATPNRLAIINTRSSIITKARDKLVEEALRVDAEYILFLDSDMVFPEDTLNRLLAHKKDIVGAVYLRRSPPHELLGSVVGQNVKVSTGLLEMQQLPMGCLLVATRVFRLFKKPYFRLIFDETFERTIGEDTDFCLRARDKGFQIWCDTDLSFEVKHIGQAAYGIQREAAIKPEPMESAA